MTPLAPTVHPSDKSAELLECIMFRHMYVQVLRRKSAALEVSAVESSPTTPTELPRIGCTAPMTKLAAICSRLSRLSRFV